MTDPFQTDDARLDEVLLGEASLEPSRGFLPATMTAVHCESDSRSPIRFPWWRLAIGLVASVAVAIPCVLARAPVAGAGPGGNPLAANVLDGLAWSAASGLAWVALVMLLSLAAVLASPVLLGRAEQHRSSW